MITSISDLSLDLIEESLYYRKDVHRLLAQCEDCVLFTSVEEAIVKYCYLDDFHLYMAKLQGHLVGLVGVELVEPKAALIHHLSVDLELRWRGIGSLMLDALIEAMDLNYLEARATELNIGFYKANNFEVHSIRAYRRKLDEYGCFWTKVV